MAAEIYVEASADNLQNSKSGDKFCCAIIGLAFTTFLLKIGLIVQYILSRYENFDLF